uniref:Gamma-glutamyltranspeptidase 1 n=1 Tax=Plectus sambesii TaxID=2011161 RepID=A0A914VT90_9BILA
MSTNSEYLPLIDDSETRRVQPRALYWITGLALVLACFLTISTLTLGIMNASVRQAAAPTPRSLPQWPKPSLSLLGRYSKAAVAVDNVYCAEVGRNILIKGGNAVDAAVATIFCMGVMTPQANGLGGGHFMTIYNGTTKTCNVVDAREVAPLAANETMFVNQSMKSQVGWLAVAVPGELHGLRTEYENFGGNLPWKELIEPSIALLKNGIPISLNTAGSLMEERSIIMNESTLSIFINPKTGDVFKYGEIMKTRTQFMDTLQILADSKDPIGVFYDGPLTNRMVKEFEENGGIITREDMRRYKATIRRQDEVIYTKLSNGRKVCGPPPPSSSAVTQSILKVLDGYTFDQTTEEGNVDIFHHYIEASKFAYAYRSRMGDMKFVNDSLALAKNITTDEFARSIRAKITDRAHPTAYYGGRFELESDHGTTSMTFMDDYGNAVSVTSTINLLFGARVRSESTGVIYNCQMDDFSTPNVTNYYGYPPSPTNYIKPGKKPQSSISPLIVFNEETGAVEMAIGGAGGSTIISGVSTVAMRTLFLGWELKDAIDAPRLHNQLLPNVTQFEPGFPTEYLDALTKRGHVMERTPGITDVTAIRRKGKYTWANSDWRHGPEAGPAGY